MKHSLKEYPIRVYWSDEDDRWIAEAVDIPFCTGDGDSALDAVDALQETFEVLQVGYVEEDMVFPAPPMLTTDALKELSKSKAIKISELARESNIPYTTLKTKLSRGTELNQKEAKKLTRTISNYIDTFMGVSRSHFISNKYNTHFYTAAKSAKKDAAKYKASRTTTKKGRTVRSKVTS